MGRAKGFIFILFDEKEKITNTYANSKPYLISESHLLNLFLLERLNNLAENKLVPFL